MPKTINQNLDVAKRKLGRIAPRSDRRAVLFADFAPTAEPPVATNFWRRRKSFPLRSWGNKSEGCCTIAKQANMFRRFERLELSATIDFATDEVHAKYRAMTDALYGGGDTGAYETDALDRSRRKETALVDKLGRSMMIDAYVRVDARDHRMIRSALYAAAGHGLAVCVNLPAAWARVPLTSSKAIWDLPTDTSSLDMTQWAPGTWGGHSMWATDYTRDGLVVEQTWDLPATLITWRAAAWFVDEVHVVIDSADYWRTRARGLPARDRIDVGGIIDAVNAVSSVRIAA